MNRKGKSPVFRSVLVGVLATCCGIGFVVSDAGGGDVGGEGGKGTLPRAGEFSLSGVKGGELTKKGLEGSKAVVFYFIDVACPLSNGYAPEMLRIRKEYGEKGVGFFGVYPDPELSSERAAAHAEEYALSFPLYLDPSQEMTRALGITMVPEVAVLLPNGQVKYRGRIDNWYSLDGERRLKPTRHDLRAALDAVLAGEEPDPAITQAYGCYLPEPTKR